jgi:hypothetical protein
VLVTRWGRGRPTPAFRRGEGLIAQSRWPRGAIWRSTGLEFGTQLDAPAGPKNGSNAYILSISGPVVQLSSNVFRGFLVPSL